MKVLLVGLERVGKLFSNGAVAERFADPLHGLSELA